MYTVIRAQWTQKVRGYFEQRGYTFTNYGDYFIIDDKDISCNSKALIQAQCVDCHTFFDISFRSYCNRKDKQIPCKCKQCQTKEKIHMWYQQIIKICQQKQYTLLTNENDIQDRNTKVVYTCPRHGKTHTTVRSLLEGKGCYWCGRDSAKTKTPQATLSKRQESLYQAAVKVAVKKGYKLLSSKEDIYNNKTYISYKCPKHGVHSMRISNFINDRNCPDCVNENNSERYRLSVDEVEQRIAEYGGRLLNKYDYVNQATKNLSVQCFECGELFLTSLRNFTQHGGQVCENCSNVKSIGEKKIRLYLTNNHINFVEQKWFNECRDINPLPFDFYLPTLHTIVEFDGRQHFEDTGYFTYSFVDTQRHDNIKNTYCKQNNIKLIRIPYWDINNIQTILDKELILHEDIV